MQLDNNTPKSKIRMTVKQENAIDAIKSWAFPALVSVCVFFLIRLNTQLEKMNETMIELKTNQKVIQYRIEDLSVDTNGLRLEVEELKKTLN